MLCAWLFSSAALAQTHVHGSISDAATQAPVAGATVRIQSQSVYTYLTIATIASSSDGTYDWTGACTAFFSVYCRIQVESTGYVDAYGYVDVTTSDAEVDLGLHRPASISGHVRWASDAAPAAGMNVIASCASANPEDCLNIPYFSTYSAADGSFSIPGMPSSTYKVCMGASDGNSVAQCYDHRDRSAFAGKQPYTPVTLTDGQALDTLDFDLSAGGALTGTMLDGYTGAPIGSRAIDLTLYDANGDYYDAYFLTTAIDGSYVLNGIADGTYYLQATDSAYPYTDYSQFYPGIACVDSTCPAPTAGTPLTFTTGSTLSSIDFTFHPIATISGRIVDAAGGHPLGGIRVEEAHCENGNCGLLSSIAISDADTGIYTLAVQDDPQIHVLTVSGRPYVDLVYPGIPCIFGQSCNAQGQDFVVQAGDHLEGVDFSMQRGASVSGQALFASGAPSSFATVWLYDSSFNAVWSGATDDQGLYQSPTWPPGTYYASADNGWGCSFYQDRPCPADGQDPSSVQPTPIPLAQGDVLEHIDFTLPAPDAIFRSGFDP